MKILIDIFDGTVVWRRHCVFVTGHDDDDDDDGGNEDDDDDDGGNDDDDGGDDDEIHGVIDTA